MNMLRALIALFVLFLAGRLLGRWLRPGAGTGRRDAATKVTRMVRCAHCGTFVPAGDALADGDRNFCSAEHRRLGPAREP